MAFVDHSQTVLAAVEGFIERVDDIIELRSSSRKAGRVLSKSNYERLSSHHSRLKELMDELSELLDVNAPNPAPEEPESQASGVATKSVNLELAEAELRFLELEQSTTL